MPGLGKHAGLGAGRAFAETFPGRQPGLGPALPAPDGHLAQPGTPGKSAFEALCASYSASGSATPGAAPGPWVQHLPHSGINPPKGGVPGRSRPPRVL